MVLKIYNTLTRRKEVFKPINDKNVGFYSCGPTVYWYQHIGNMRSFICNDLLKRTLIYNGYKVKHVINITDVGHLTSDADVGEDKMYKAIVRENLPLTKESMLYVADKYTKVFKSDLKKLNVLEPDYWPKATEHIPEMIEIIKKIEKNGYTYKTSVGLIYDTSKFPDYTKLGNLKLEDLEAGARVEVDPERRNPSDFALWITNQPNHIMQWDSPWGKGFPGWHIECTAMSSKYLGEQFDIHSGGEEHIAVHHTNEIAQSEAAFGKKPWVKYWFHIRWLLVKGEKMSKSKGEIYKLSDLEEMGYKPMDFRYLCLLTHYRKHLNFTLEALDNAKNAFDRLSNIVIELKSKDDSIKTEDYKKYKNDFLKAINDDLNIPQAVSVLWEMLRDKNLGSKEKLELAYDFDNVFGLGLKDIKETKVEIPQEIKDIAEEREKARKEKNWEKSDKLRELIKEKGYEIIDGKDGYIIKKVIKNN